MVEALLKAGADPKTLTTGDGETVLMTAARAGNVDVVRLLLDRGADVNAREKYKGQTALMWAAAERHPAVVKLLLEHGADWKVRSFDRETKIPKLSAASSITPIRTRRIHGAVVCRPRGRHRIRAHDARRGVDINYGDVDNTSALVVSIMNKQYTLREVPDRSRRRREHCRRLRPHGAVRDRRHPQRGLRPRCPTGRPTIRCRRLDIVKALLDRGAKVNAALTASLPGRSGMDSGDTTLDAGTTPLMRAARAGDAAVMRLLLERVPTRR